MSEKIFQWLLRLYPRRFRSEYDGAMRQLFRDRLAAETGILGRLRLWTDLLRDLAISVPREHRRSPQSTAAQSGVYRMSEEAVAEMVRRSHLRQLPPLLLLIALGVLISWFGDAPRWPSCGIYGLLITFITVASLRCKHGWRGYELVLAEDRIQQMQGDRVVLTLAKTDVTRIAVSDFGMAIQTHDLRKSVWVPSVLNRYEELRSRLAAWAPLQLQEDPHENQRRVRQHSAVGWMIAIYPAALLVRSPFFAIPLTAFLGGFLLHLTRRLMAPRTLPDGAILKAPATVWLVPSSLIALLVVKLLLILR